MSKKLSGVKPDEVRRILRDLGYEKIKKRGKGSHESWRHVATGRWTTLSWKANVVPTGTLKRICKDIGVSTAKFRRLL